MMLDKNTSSSKIPAPQKIGLRTSFDGTANLTFQPRNVKRKLIYVDVSGAVAGSKHFFQYDKEIDNSVILGIRFHPNNVSAAPQNGTLTSTPPGADYFLIDFVIALNMMIVLTNEQEEVIMNPYPLVALSGYRGSLNDPPKVTPRFYTRLSLTKCYIQYIPGGAALDPNSFVAIEFFYKPVQLNKI